MRLLLMSDNPNLPTGMGTVGREIALGLHRRGIEIHYLGWFSGDIQNRMPFPIFKTHNMYYGSDIFDNAIYRVFPDIVLTVGDEWMVNHIADKKKCKSRNLFKWIGYVPIDGHAIHGGIPNSWGNTLRSMDYVVAYTDYGRKVIKKSCPELEVQMIPHGVNIKQFRPLPEDKINELRKKYNIQDKVVYLVVARNQFRKNIPEIFKAWKIFKARGNEKAKLWLHCFFKDPMGWNIDELAEIYGIKDDLLFFENVAHGESNVKLLSEEQLSILYNMCDIFLLQSGEGFGLPTVEAMACGKPVILLDHSANTEIGRGRGELVRVSTYMSGKHSTERPYPDLKDLAEKMEKLYKDEELRMAYGRAGYNFTRGLDWDYIGSMWYELLLKIENPLYKGLKLREVT